jgi:hypothetical protein
MEGLEKFGSEKEVAQFLRKAFVDKVRVRHLAPRPCAASAAPQSCVHAIKRSPHSVLAEAAFRGLVLAFRTVSPIARCNIRPDQSEWPARSVHSNWAAARIGHDTTPKTTSRPTSKPSAPGGYWW